MLERLASDPNIDLIEQEECVRSSNDRVRVAIASNPHLEPAYQNYFANGGNVFVIMALTRNKGIRRDCLERIANWSKDTINLLAYGSSPYWSHEDHKRLINDQERSIRAGVALSDACTPETMATLLKDTEAEVQAVAKAALKRKQGEEWEALKLLYVEDV
jgi:hypothetical protein